MSTLGMLAIGSITSVVYLVLREKKYTWPLPPIAEPPYDVGPRVVTLRAAIRSGWLVDIWYVDKNNKVTHRTIKPSSIQGDIIAADCHQANDERHFRIDRIITLAAQTVRADARDRHTIGPTRKKVKENTTIDLYPIGPRQEILSEAIARGWLCSICYLKEDGKKQEIEYRHDKLTRFKPETITFLEIGDELISLKRIAEIKTQASTEKLSAQYRILESEQYEHTTRIPGRSLGMGWILLAGIACMFVYEFIERQTTNDSLKAEDVQIERNVSDDNKSKLAASIEQQAHMPGMKVKAAGQVLSFSLQNAAMSDLKAVIESLQRDRTVTVQLLSAGFSHISYSNGTDIATVELDSPAVPPDMANPIKPTRKKNRRTHKPDLTANMPRSM